MKILIVEDIFIEADHLSLILVKAGHRVTAIARTVEQALAACKKERPDLVMLDIFLKGNLTGIHLAGSLTRQHIPFIYLSANSNPSTLQLAKETNPDGFLVKPFRERDILVALDIAIYRRTRMREYLDGQEQWLKNLLQNLIEQVTTRDQKLLLLVKALQQVIPFDHLLIEINNFSGDLASMDCFERAGLDQYQRVDVSKPTRIQPDPWDASASRLTNHSPGEPLIRNGADFYHASCRLGLLEHMRNSHRSRSALTIGLLGASGMSSRLTFLSKQAEGFSASQSDLLGSLSNLLTATLDHIRQYRKASIAVPGAGLADIDMRLEGIIGRSPGLLRALDLARLVSKVSSTVLILGETGVGKEGIATAIHQLSGRSNRPLVKVNCAGMPATLVESELFGHEAGAFTDATSRRIGKFEQAQGGTIFLDEIGEMPIAAQTKLLRVLQEKEIERVGGSKVVKLDVRVIAATNRDLFKEVEEGRFRMDLYYRLNVFPILLPPLRERKEDIALLAEHFLENFAHPLRKTAKTLSAEALQQLLSYSWPGNIRELQHLIERHVLIAPNDVIERVELPRDLPSSSAESLSSAVIPPFSDKEVILDALEKCKGKVSGRGGAAELLGLNPNTLSSRMRKHGLYKKFNL